MNERVGQPGRNARRNLDALQGLGVIAMAALTLYGLVQALGKLL